MTTAGQVNRTPTLADVLDRVLDRGIVIDAHVRVSVMSLHIVDVEARVIVASVETYLEYGEDLALTGLASRLDRVEGLPPTSPYRGDRPGGDEDEGTFFLVRFDPDPWD